MLTIFEIIATMKHDTHPMRSLHIKLSAITLVLSLALSHFDVGLITLCANTDQTTSSSCCGLGACCCDDHEGSACGSDNSVSQDSVSSSIPQMCPRSFTQCDSKTPLVQPVQLKHFPFLICFHERAVELACEIFSFEDSGTALLIATTSVFHPPKA